MALFDRPKIDDKKLIDKAKSTVQRSSVKGGKSVVAQVQSIINLAESKLIHHKDDYMLIQTEESLEEYLNHILDNGICAFDTETTGLNPFTVDIVGVCLYTPNQKAAYIPINHKSHITGTKTANQLTEETVKKYLEKLSNCRIIMHNSKFDIRIVRHTLEVDLPCAWDTMLAGYCINENESHALKDLHLKYCDSNDTESLTFGSLFNGISFDNVPINVAYLYAAGDAIKTFELYEYQKKILNRRNLPGPYRVFSEIEMPLVKVVADMEDRGICLDFDICKNLSDKYNKIKEESYEVFYHSLKKYHDVIETFGMKFPEKYKKLTNPISPTSPTQLSILFYDILGLGSPNKNQPRGTGEDILKHFAQGEHSDICKAILDIRGVEKLLSTYIEKMPSIVEYDKRIHCSFHQYGAKTGRFSSSDPNMQNIPSHNKEIRLMFKAEDGYVLVGGDYSQQEPKLTAHLSQDKTMLKAFQDGKDIYSTIASLAFNKPYEDCLEFRPDGTTNKSGKERRTQAKSIVLGILYGRQIPSIAEQLNVSKDTAQNIYDRVLQAFPALKKFMHNSQKMARELGYVDTAWGRRRHLDDMRLEPYEFTSTVFDPLSFTDVETEVPKSVKDSYIRRLKKAYGYKAKNDIILDAKQKGIKIKDNGGFIAQAERQCVNARVQGSAADVTKVAMINIHNDQILNDLGFHLLIQVHDEVIGECPVENAFKVKDRLQYVMSHAVDNIMEVPMKCDIEITRNWYGESVEGGNKIVRETITARQFENEITGYHA